MSALTQRLLEAMHPFWRRVDDDGSALTDRRTDIARSRLQFLIFAVFPSRPSRGGPIQCNHVPSNAIHVQNIVHTPRETMLDVASVLGVEPLI